MKCSTTDPKTFRSSLLDDTAPRHVWVHCVSVITLLRDLPTVITHAAIHLFGLGWHVWYAFHKVKECMRRGKTVELMWRGRDDLWFNGIIWINSFLQDTHTCADGLVAEEGRAVVMECPPGCPSSCRNMKKCHLWSPSRGINVIMCPWTPLQWTKSSGVPFMVSVPVDKHVKVPSDAPPVHKIWLSALQGAPPVDKIWLCNL